MNKIELPDHYSLGDAPLRKECVDQFQLTTENIIEIAETAYRRGYSQGIARASYYLMDGVADAESLVEHALDVYEWRIKKHRGKAEYPPVMWEENPKNPL